jgi:hypothetical protein
MSRRRRWSGSRPRRSWTDREGPDRAHVARFDSVAGDTGTAHGSCGTSYVSIDDAAQPDIYRFKTGFKVKGDAVDFSWEIDVRGEAGKLALTA